MKFYGIRNINTREPLYLRISSEECGMCGSHEYYYLESESYGRYCPWLITGKDAVNKVFSTTTKAQADNPVPSNAHIAMGEYEIFEVDT